ncbi:MAG TPA: hypothetical protein VGM63_06865 [Mucilaginibacter sp.]|jgi:hypothetical protein
MEIIDRIYNYLNIKKINASEFEKACKISNGYLSNRGKNGTRGIGSDILEKIYKTYSDLNLIWLITGDGEMLISPQAQSQAQPQAQHKKNEGSNREGELDYSEPGMINVMQDHINSLKATVADKDKIIQLLEGKPSPQK